jgi:flagellar FliL protein
MAKKSSEEDAGENADAEASGEGASGGRKKKLIMFGAIGVVALGLLGGGWFVFLRGAPAQEAVVKKPVSFLDMREMTVNLAPDNANDRTRLLKFKVALEVNDPKLVPQVQALMPRVEDSFQTFLRELRASDLEGSRGLYRLREELLRRVNIAVYPSKVDAVLLKEMIVQ